MIFNKPIDEITPADILHLINVKYPENKFLDYKRELRLDSEYCKKDFVNDLCAFANAEGGDLLIGVSEFDGSPNRVYGIRFNTLIWKNMDDYTKALIDIARAFTQPNIPDMQLRALKVLDKWVLIIRTPKSFTGPHCHRDDNRFYVRVGNKKDMMDYTELKNIFLDNEKHLDQINTFIHDRINSMYIGNNFAGIADAPTFALFLIPQDSFNFGKSIAVDKFADYAAPYSVARTEQLPSSRVNIDGLLYYDAIARGSYTLYYKNGIIESASTACFDISHKAIDLARLTGVTLDATQNFFQYLKQRKSRDVFAVAAIINAKRYTLQNVDKAEPIDRDIISTEPILINSESMETTLKPVFTELMSAFGLRRAMLKYPGKPAITL